MTGEEMKRLEELAKAATPGPWEYNGHRIQAVEPVPVDWADEPQNPSVIWDPFCFEHPDVDRSYVVAANPAAVLALIERVRKAEARAKRMESALREVVRWDLPRVPDRDDPTRTVSCGFEYGSNGERDFMRDIAAKALVDS